HIEEKDQAVSAVLAQLQRHADEIITVYPDFARVAHSIHEMKATVEQAIREVVNAGLDDATKTDLLYRLFVKEAQLHKASLEATSLIVRLKPDTGELVAGQTTRVTLTAYNGGTVALSNLQFVLRVPAGWQAKALGLTRFAQLENNQTVCTTYEIMVPKDTELFDPYVSSVVYADIAYQIGETVTSVRVDPEVKIAVLPAYSLSLSPGATVLN
ncbi:NEW3 domain-containing protein, partial [Microbacteriaceae bacterium K1510]|nr:NEW3 domain-containing protein [Microbacteriaceae bacterium K1510]